MPDKSISRPEWFDKAFVELHGDWLGEVITGIIHEVMEEEVSSLVGAGYGERNPERTTHRNRYRERQWTPPCRNRTVTCLRSPSILPRWARIFSVRPIGR